ncbi:hypothetical protein FKM82_001601 [Ascaphus truei]
MRTCDWISVLFRCIMTHETLPQKTTNIVCSTCTIKIPIAWIINPPETDSVVHFIELTTGLLYTSFQNSQGTSSGPVVVQCSE